MDMQNVSNLQIPEGVVRTIHDKNSRLLWGRVHYDTKYAGDTLQNGTPTPDTPISVQVVTGEQTVNVHSKNLYNSPNRSQTRYGLTAAIADNRVTIDGTATRNNFGETYFNLNGTDNANANYYNYDNTTSGITLPAGTYTLSLNNTTGTYASPSGIIVYISKVYAGQYPTTTLGYISFTQGATSNTFTLLEETTIKIQFRIFISSDTSVAVPVFNNYSFDFQLEEGPAATSYEPYQSQSYEINLGKNLFDPVAAEITRGLLRSGGSIDYSSTNRLFTKGFIKVEPNTTYTFQFKSGVAGKVVQSYALAYQADKTTVTGGLPTIAWYGSGFTFTTGPNDEYIRMSYHFTDNSDMSITDVVEQQLELSSTATLYAPYFTPIELCKIGNYQDYIYKSGDDWYVHKATNKIILDGSTTFSAWTEYGITGFYNNSLGTDAIALTVPGISYVSSSRTVIPRINGSMVQFSEYIAAYPTDYAITIKNNSPGVAIRDIRYTDAASLNNWLTSNPETLYYALATATDAQITDAALIAQLNAVHQWLTRYGYNSTVTGNLPIIIDRTNL